VFFGDDDEAEGIPIRVYVLFKMNYGPDYIEEGPFPTGPPIITADDSSNNTLACYYIQELAPIYPNKRPYPIYEWRGIPEIATIEVNGGLSVLSDIYFAGGLVFSYY
jgi:hypothetical protein